MSERPDLDLIADLCAPSEYDDPDDDDGWWAGHVATLIAYARSLEARVDALERMLPPCPRPECSNGPGNPQPKTVPDRSVATGQPQWYCPECDETFS